ncbi:MAG TPA: sulfatase-like hydrolase/transferase [Vicinamibacterales bacterium]
MSRPFRYTLILVVVALAVALAAAGGWRYARASAPVSGPIVIISIDTLRADHLPVYGYTKVKTPAIDALAADGVAFERAYSHAPQTLPAHAALFSGRLPFETGVRDNVGFTIKNGERLLPQMLHDRGFSTGGVVSAFVLRKETGIAQGFDYFDGDMPAAANDTSIAQVQRDGAVSEALAEKWLNGLGTGRAFLFLHLYEPHKPYTPPDRFAQYAPYDGEIAYSDEIVGTFIKYLKAHQLYDRSTIILLGDHGEGLGDHGEQEHGLFVYEEAIHVPLIIKQESNVGAGRRVKDLVQHIDIVPTVLDFVKAPIPGQLHGRSLKPLLEGTGTLPPAPVYSEALYARYHFGWSELTALTDERYRYIKAPREELYDLERDPHERTNIADDKSQARQAMRTVLDQVAAGATIQAPSAVTADARERLQALGYVGASTEAASGTTALAPGDELADPKDKRDILERYRAAVDLAGERRFPGAIALLQQILRSDPGMADVWAQLASFALRVDRYDQALDAYKHYIVLKPAEPQPYLGAAGALLRLRKYADAREHAELAAQVAGDKDPRAAASAHEMLARIALIQKDAETARAEARRAEDADSTMPMTAYVEGRILYDQGRYGDAMPSFEQAIAELRNPGSRPPPELYYYAGDTLARLERYHDAEVAFDEELKRFPLNNRARVGLAMLYQANGRPDAAEQAIKDMVRITPTQDTYALAARLFTMFGNRQGADAVRAEARRALNDASGAGTRGARH